MKRRVWNQCNFCVTMMVQLKLSSLTWTNLLFVCTFESFWKRCLQWQEITFGNILAATEKGNKLGMVLDTFEGKGKWECISKAHFYLNGKKHFQHSLSPFHAVMQSAGLPIGCYKRSQRPNRQPLTDNSRATG